MTVLKYAVNIEKYSKIKGRGKWRSSVRLNRIECKSRQNLKHKKEEGCIHTHVRDAYLPLI